MSRSRQLGLPPSPRVVLIRRFTNRMGLPCFLLAGPCARRLRALRCLVSSTTPRHRRTILTTRTAEGRICLRRGAAGHEVRSAKLRPPALGNVGCAAELWSRRSALAAFPLPARRNGSGRRRHDGLARSDGSRNHSSGADSTTCHTVLSGDGMVSIARLAGCCTCSRKPFFSAETSFFSRALPTEPRGKPLPRNVGAYSAETL
jgi:hypothetical protein